MVHGLRIWFCLAVLFGSFAGRGQAQSSAHLRLFRLAGTYPAIVSVSPNGTTLAKSGDSSTLTLLDGYARRDIPMPEEITYRVHQSRSGQIWSVTSQGLLLYHGGAWTLFAVPEIRAFLSNPARHLRQVALLPAEVNHVLVLFPDRLIEFETISRQTRLLKEASATRLGEFSEIQEGLNETIWVSGTFGAAQIADSPRRVTAQSAWTEWLVPDPNQASHLQRIFEGPPGELTCSATSPGAASRSILRFQNGSWTAFPLPQEKVRQAWRSWDGLTWGFSTVSLFHLNETAQGFSLHHEQVSGAQYEVAVETNGVFWVASAEGLLRYAPPLWRSRPDLDDLQTSVQSIVFDPAGGAVWLATPAALIRQSGSGRDVFAWPEELEILSPRKSAFLLPDGRLLAGGPARPMLFDPASGRFTPVPAPAGVRVHLAGQLRDGSVCAWFEPEDRDGRLDLRLFKEEEFQKIDLPDEEWMRGEVSFVKEASNGDLWVCLGATLMRVRAGTGAVEHHGVEAGLRTDRINALAETGEGRIWCGTASRIYEYRGQRWELVLSTMDRVTDILPARGAVWVATLSGIQRFQENTWLSHGTGEGLPSGTIYALRLAPNDQIWAGTSRGALVFHPDADLDPPRTLPPTLEESPRPAAGEPAVLYFRGQDKWDYTPAANLLFSYRLNEGAWTPFSNIASRAFQRLSSGTHVVEVLAMDRNGNKSLSPGRLEFAVVLPWFRDPRLVSVSVLALCITLILAGLAVNRHLQLKRSYAEVEQMVAERTRELERATQELLHSQKMRAIGTMAAGIAHDFNNILSIIKGSAQIIENNAGDKEKIRTRVGRIQLVVEQGTAIVRALLGLGQTDDKETARCDLGELLHETRKLLSDQFAESVQLQVNVSPDLPPVRCAREVLQQILLNLILNAVEAMHNQGVIELSAGLVRRLPPKLVLEPARDEKPGADPRFAIISVMDQGMGIPEESLSRIFEPFYTTKAFSSRRGTGLGLSMVYELAKGLGYGLAVESKPGEGSVFSIILPVAEAISPSQA